MLLPTMSGDNMMSFPNKTYGGIIGETQTENVSFTIIMREEDSSSGFGVVDDKVEGIMVVKKTTGEWKFYKCEYLHYNNIISLFKFQFI